MLHARRPRWLCKPDFVLETDIDMMSISSLNACCQWYSHPDACYCMGWICSQHCMCYTDIARAATAGPPSAPQGDTVLSWMQNHANDLSCLTTAGLAWHNIACDELATDISKPVATLWSQSSSKAAVQPQCRVQIQILQTSSKTFSVKTRLQVKCRRELSSRTSSAIQTAPAWCMTSYTCCR